MKGYGRGRAVLVALLPQKGSRLLYRVSVSMPSKSDSSALSFETKRMRIELTRQPWERDGRRLFLGCFFGSFWFVLGCKAVTGCCC
jgi:hypothetical protein